MPTIRTITMNDLNNLGIDEGNNLYWEGQPLVVRHRMSLPWFVNVAVIVGGLATAIMAAIHVLQYLGIQADPWFPV